MPIVTPRNVAMSDGKFEVSIYRGATDDRVEFGVTAKALVDQNNDWEHWAGNQLVQIGDRFRRRVYNWNGTDWTRLALRLRGARARAVQPRARGRGRRWAADGRSRRAAALHRRGRRRQGRDAPEPARVWRGCA